MTALIAAEVAEDEETIFLIKINIKTTSEVVETSIKEGTVEAIFPRIGTRINMVKEQSNNMANRTISIPRINFTKINSKISSNMGSRTISIKSQ